MINKFEYFTYGLMFILGIFLFQTINTLIIFLYFKLPAYLPDFNQNTQIYLNLVYIEYILLGIIAGIIILAYPIINLIQKYKILTKSEYQKLIEYKDLITKD